MDKYTSIKWINTNEIIRKTKEVDIKVTISKDGKKITVIGKGDLKHHLIEDTAILINKVAEIICGHKISGGIE